MNIDINTKIDVSELLGVVIRKTLEFKKLSPLTENEFKIFWKNLSKDEKFLEAYKNIVKVNH
jgi:hypothetical protein